MGFRDVGCRVCGEGVWGYAGAPGKLRSFGGVRKGSEGVDP